ncbi:hypothetical protein AU184_26435 [Mycolicibacterium novocastrense]|nr:hypothetical protein [Mycolicibacterium novocastrense]KUH67487.1 hypothetical protein AU183_00170 [Mycolicibacterium novocastrense]KUH68207.1 hypothetical protein AU184_26435 [Mycolicibacterium novocastrense]KUH74381.1 hypothetical protein AU072_17310 [Mycolicibacterium novocastrense]
MSAKELDRMIESALSNPEAQAALERLDPTFLAGFDLSEEERRIIELPNPQVLAELGVHPMLAMWGSWMRNPELARQLSASEYFVDYPANRSGR